MASRVHLINPSNLSFGVAVITPRWLIRAGGGDRHELGRPEHRSTKRSNRSISNRSPRATWSASASTPATRCAATRSAALARERGAWVVFGGIHATLFPDEVHEHGAAHAVVKGDGDVVWSKVVADCFAGTPQRIYDGGRIDGDQFLPARWDLLPKDSYMWASVQTVRGCPKHCSFCSVWRTDGQEPRQREVDRVVKEVVELRRLGFRFIALADDNFYPVTFEDLAMAQAPRRQDPAATSSMALRAERFALMAQLEQLPDDIVFFTQITMEAAEDTEFLDAMRRAHIRGALVGVEAVTARRAEGRLQGLQPRPATSWSRGCKHVPQARRPRARLVHLRAAERREGHLRRHRRAGREGGPHLRAVRPADAVPRHARLREVGEGRQEPRHARWTASRSRSTG